MCRTCLTFAATLSVRGDVDRFATRERALSENAVKPEERTSGQAKDLERSRRFSQICPTSPTRTLITIICARANGAILLSPVIAAEEESECLALSNLC